MQSVFFNNLVQAYADWFKVEFDVTRLYAELGFSDGRYFERGDLMKSFAYLDGLRKH